jgi:hypothetical protein
MDPSSVEDSHAFGTSVDEQDAKQLSTLRLYRERLEREAGRMAESERRHQLRLAVVGGAALLAALYAAWATLTSENPPIITWVVTGVLAVVAAAFARGRNRSERERTRELDELHEKMLSAGRRIDGAERRMRG